MEFVKLAALRIFTAEDIVYGDQPLYKAIFKEAKRLKLAGGTLIRADQGYGTEVRGTGRAVPTFFSGTPNLPIIIEIIDMRENLMKIIPFLEKAGQKHFLATFEEVHVLVTDYTRSHAQQLRNVFIAERGLSMPPDAYEGIDLSKL